MLSFDAIKPGPTPRSSSPLHSASLAGPSGPTATGVPVRESEGAKGYDTLKSELESSNQSPVLYPRDIAEYVNQPLPWKSKIKSPFDALRAKAFRLRLGKIETPNQKVLTAVEAFSESNSEKRTNAVDVVLKHVLDVDEEHFPAVWSGLEGIDQHMTSVQKSQWSALQYIGKDAVAFLGRIEKIEDESARTSAIVAGLKSSDPGVCATAATPALTHLLRADHENEQALWSELNKIKDHLRNDQEIRWTAIAKVQLTEFLKDIKGLKTPNERALAAVKAFGSPNPLKSNAAIDCALENLPFVDEKTTEATLWAEIGKLEITPDQGAQLTSIADAGLKALMEKLQGSFGSETEQVSHLVEAFRSPNGKKRNYAIDTAISRLPTLSVATKTTVRHELAHIDLSSSQRLELWTLHEWPIEEPTSS